MQLLRLEVIGTRRTMAASTQWHQTLTYTNFNKLTVLKHKCNIAILMCMNRFHSVAVSIHSRWIVNISFWFLGWGFIIDDDGGAGFPLHRDYGKMDITLSPLVKTMNGTGGKFSLPSSTYIISPLPLFYSPVITIPLCWPWTCTCTHIRPFFLFHGLICLLASLSASLCQAFTHLSSLRSPLPLRNGFRWANFISVMPLVCNSQFGFSGKWPPLFIEGLFIWTTWLLCPNPEITFGWLWKGWCVSVIRWLVFSCWTDTIAQWQWFCLAQAKTDRRLWLWNATSNQTKFYIKKS